MDESIYELKQKYDERMENKKKQQKISRWKQKMYLNDFDAFYNEYINAKKCYSCRLEFINENDKCVKRLHYDKITMIICRKCVASKNY